MAINVPQKPQTLPNKPAPELRNGPMTRKDRMNAMMADEQNPNGEGGKIGSIAMFTLMGWAILCDLIDIILTIFLLDDFFIIDIMNLVVFVYFYVKKVDMTPMYVPSIIELIPWVSALPTRTICIGGTIILDTWPDSSAAKILKTLGMVGKKVSAGAGKGGGSVAPKISTK